MTVFIFHIFIFSNVQIVNAFYAMYVAKVTFQIGYISAIVTLICEGQPFYGKFPSTPVRLTTVNLQRLRLLKMWRSIPTF